MLRVLVDGLRSEEDYHLYRKRRVFAHVMAIFNSPFVGKESKVGNYALCIMPFTY